MCGRSQCIVTSVRCVLTRHHNPTNGGAQLSVHTLADGNRDSRKFILQWVGVVNTNTNLLGAFRIADRVDYTYLQYTIDWFIHSYYSFVIRNRSIVPTSFRFLFVDFSSVVPVVGYAYHQQQYDSVKRSIERQIDDSQNHHHRHRHRDDDETTMTRTSILKVEAPWGCKLVLLASSFWNNVHHSVADPEKFCGFVVQSSMTIDRSGTPNKVLILRIFRKKWFIL